MPSIFIGAKFDFNLRKWFYDDGSEINETEWEENRRYEICHMSKCDSYSIPPVMNDLISLDLRQSVDQENGESDQFYASMLSSNQVKQLEALTKIEKSYFVKKTRFAVCAENLQATLI